MVGVSAALCTPVANARLAVRDRQDRLLDVVQMCWLTKRHLSMQCLGHMSNNSWVRWPYGFG